MRKLFLFGPLLALLSACQPPMTREQELAIYRSYCFDYGFQPGTVDFARCMQEQEARQEELYMKERKLKAIEERNRIERNKVIPTQNNIYIKEKKRRKIYNHKGY